MGTEKVKYTLSQDALDRLAEVKKHILSEPARFRMNIWTDYDEGPACLTTGCIAGWVLALDHMKRNHVSALVASHSLSELFPYSPEDAAGDLLGLTLGERKALFYLNGWPFEYSDAYNDIADRVIQREDMLPACREEILKARVNNARVFALLIDSVIKERSIWWIQL